MDAPPPLKTSIHINYENKKNHEIYTGLTKNEVHDTMALRQIFKDIFYTLKKNKSLVRWTPFGNTNFDTERVYIKLQDGTVIIVERHVQPKKVIYGIFCEKRQLTNIDYKEIKNNALLYSDIQEDYNLNDGTKLADINGLNDFEL